MDFNNVEKYIRDGGSPEEIAQAFADQLNAVLSRIEDEKAVVTKSQEVAENWKSFVTAYFHVHPFPEGVKVEDFFLSSDDVVKLLETFVEIVPMFVKYGSVIENFATGAEKILDTKINKNSFTETMENFFNKLNI